jgi:hypothetical protein
VAAIIAAPAFRTARRANDTACPVQRQPTLYVALTMTVGDRPQRDTDPEAQVRALIRRFVGERKRITRSTRLFHDLGIGGDDAWELLESVAKHFEASFAGIDFAAYFSNEGEASIYFWFMRVGRFRSRVKPMTVAHLVAVASRGSWFDPPIGH